MLPVTLLTGIDEAFRGAVAGNASAAAGPTGVLVEYDVSRLTEGSVVRIARAAAAELRVDAIVATVDTGSMIADLTGEQLIQDRGIPTAAQDGRAIAEVIARQLESANAAILSSDDGSVRALVLAVNPQLLVRTTPAGLLGVRLDDPAATEPGSIVAPLEDDGPVRTLVWQSDRPFHPERLYDALEDLVAGTARGWGTVWIATQHRNRLSWDSFGTSIAIGVLGPWLADLPADRWSTVGQQHQARSALEWHPEHGDRASDLSITGVGLDVRELRERLDGCVLRADEAVHPLTDPFAPYLEGRTAA